MSSEHLDSYQAITGLVMAFNSICKCACCVKAHNIIKGKITASTNKQLSQIVKSSLDSDCECTLCMSLWNGAEKIKEKYGVK